MSLIDQSRYSTHFSTRHYLQMYYSEVEEDFCQYFRGKFFKDFFQKYSCKWDKSSAKLLDFSGGAVICNYISAAPYVAEIVHSAYIEEERRELELWVSDSDGAHNWNPYIQHAVSVIEGQEGETAWKERAALLRSKIKVVSCNVYDEHPIDLSKEESRFSIICTSFALEAACKTYAEFKSVVQKLVKLLRLGGYIIIFFVEDGTFYYEGEKKFAMLPVSLAQVQEAVEEAGCVVLMSERDPTSIDHLENPTLSDKKAYTFLAAYKVKN